MYLILPSSVCLLSHFSLLAIRTIFSKETAIIQQSTADETIKGIGLSTIGGFIAGMTGIGGGSIMAPLIGQLKSVKAHQIAPYTNAMMFIGGLGSLYGYLSKKLDLSLWLANRLRKFFDRDYCRTQCFCDRIFIDENSR